MSFYRVKFLKISLPLPGSGVVGGSGVFKRAAFGGTGVVEVTLIGAAVVAAGRGLLFALLGGKVTACGRGLRVVRLLLEGLLFLAGSLVLGLKNGTRS
jgi:hypothetical protein